MNVLGIDPVALATIMAVVVPILQQVNAVKWVTSKTAQLWVIGISAAYVLVPAFFDGRLTLDNSALLALQVTAIVSLNVFFYEYIVKNIVRYVWPPLKRIYEKVIQ